MTDGAPMAAPDLLKQVQRLEAENRQLRTDLARFNAHETAAEPAVPATGPIFVGGTGRSGTWLIGRLLAKHPDYVAVHTELRVHASPNGGFRRVVDGIETPLQFTEFVRDQQFAITSARGQFKGLALVASGAQLQAASARLVERAPIDLPAALGGFLHELVDPYALGRGGRSWIETTPANAQVADVLCAAFPHARVINIVRDGRDVATSVASMPWGPNRPSASMRWWATRIRAVHTAMSAAPADRVMTVRFEELVVSHREQRLHELLDFAGVEAVKPLLKYFQQRVGAGSANIGRWRSVSSIRRRRLDRQYRAIYAQLSADGITGLPADPETVDQLAG